MDIYIMKAEPIAGESPVEDLHVHFVQRVKSLAEKLPLHTWDFLCIEEARRLFNALRSSLPGAVFDRLLVLMLEEKASHFIVPHKMMESDQLERDLNQMAHKIVGRLQPTLVTTIRDMIDAGKTPAEIGASWYMLQPFHKATGENEFISGLVGMVAHHLYLGRKVREEGKDNG